MPCTSPLKGFRSVEKGPTGTPLITFNPLRAINSHLSITLPCGKCMDCRIARVNEWATRLSHEAQMHEHSSFVTFTYDDDNLPEDYSVSKRVCQLLMKRMRKFIPQRLRYYIAAEYGEQTLRPHYHALIFGFAFPDRELYSTTTDGDRLFTSALLHKIWPFGQALIGDVTPASAAYTAGYITKKIGGDLAASHYLRQHPKSGLLVQVQPEFALQSSRPGIGSTWYEKFKSDCFPSDFLIVHGKFTKVPRYYTKKLAEEELTRLKRTRKRKSVTPQAKANKSPARLRAREEITKSRLSRSKRTL